MSSDGVEVEGLDRFNRTMHQLADDLTDLEPANRRAAEVALERADPRTPRQSGRLAASGRVDAASDEAAVIYDEVYAGVVHFGWQDRNITPQPWLAETFDESTAAVTGVYVDHVADLVHHVRGA